MAPRECTVLGGGVAGLATAHFARRAGLSCTLFEAAGPLGGNARTLAVSLPAGEFRYDTGAHRFHGLDPDVTAEMRRLIGEDLRQVTAPSLIYYRGGYVDFPPRGGNLLRALGPLFCLRAGIALAWARACPPGDAADFASVAIRKYGPVIARPFLLDYSEKLWGRPGARLSPVITGRRLKGLRLRSFLRELVLGPGHQSGTMEGAFHYPLDGIGRIAEVLADSAGRDRLHTGSRVTRVRHDGRRVTAVEAGGRVHAVPAGSGLVVNTLPLGILLGVLDPPPPPQVLAAASSLPYRDVVLVAVFLDRESVTTNATVYFPGAEFPFTRVCEPRNRSPRMAPPGKTSLVAEIPLESGEPGGEKTSGPSGASLPNDRSWLRPTIDALASIGWLREREVLGSAVHRMRRAYPVLEVGVEARLAEATTWLSSLANLRTVGRVGTFTYTHLHDHIRAARDLIADAVVGEAELFLGGPPPASELVTSGSSAGRAARPDAAEERPA